MTAFVEEAYLEFEKASLAYDAFRKFTDLADRAYKVKTYVEEASLYPGLESIFLEEQEKGKPSNDPKTQSQGKGLIATVWDKLVGFFKRIAEIIFGKKAESIKNAKEVEVDKEIMDIGAENDKLLAEISKKKKGFLLGAGAIAAAIGAGCLIFNKVKKNKEASQVKIKVSGDAMSKYYNKLKSDYQKMADIIANGYMTENGPMSAAERLKFDKEWKALEPKIMKYNEIMGGKLKVENVTPEEGESFLAQMLGKVGNAIKEIPNLVTIIGGDESGEVGVETKHRKVTIHNA